jgi:YbgC/YbaW family acyl-CoA thioester hydrolase
MNLLFRLLFTLIMSKRREKCPLKGPARVAFRCWFTDLDVLLHMNNAKYLALLDLARLDLMIRSGVYEKLKENDFYPVIAAETIRFRKSLKLFDAFEIETTVLGWDEKAFILEQVFLKNGEQMAIATVRARFLKKQGGTVAPEEILSMVNAHEISPEFSEAIRTWNTNMAQEIKLPK